MAERPITIRSSGEKEPLKVLNMGGSQFATVSDSWTYHLGLQRFVKSTNQKNVSDSKAPCFTTYMYAWIHMSALENMGHASELSQVVHQSYPHTGLLWAVLENFHNWAQDNTLCFRASLRVYSDDSSADLSSWDSTALFLFYLCYNSADIDTRSEGFYWLQRISKKS